MVRIGVDLGGSKISLAALDDSGRCVLSLRTATPAGDYAATVDAVGQLVTQAEQHLDTRARVGIGTPGSLSPATGLIRNANSTCLNDHALHHDLAARLNREIRITNDADCFTVSEATDGAAVGASCVFGVILGTGVGGGLVINGRLLYGTNGIAGEWGHNPLPLPADDDLPLPACYCGRTGCIETYLSGPGMADEHRRLTGRDMSTQEIAADAERLGPCSEATMARYEQRLARALASVINILDPEVIVLGGGLSNIERLYENVPRLWEPFIFSDVVNTRLVRNHHGDDSGVRGAAWLWPA